MNPEGIYTGARNGLTFQGKQTICQSPATLIALHFFVVSPLDHSSLLSPHVCSKLGFQWLMDKKQLLNKRPCGMRNMRGNSQSLFTAGSCPVLRDTELLEETLSNCLALTIQQWE